MKYFVLLLLVAALLWIAYILRSNRRRYPCDGCDGGNGGGGGDSGGGFFSTDCHGSDGGCSGGGGD